MLLLCRATSKGKVLLQRRTKGSSYEDFNCLSCQSFIPSRQISRPDVLLHTVPQQNPEAGDYMPQGGRLGFWSNDGLNSSRANAPCTKAGPSPLHTQPGGLEIPRVKRMVESGFSSDDFKKGVKELCDQGRLYEALCAVDGMGGIGIQEFVKVICFVIQGCTAKKDLHTGRKLHAVIRKNGLQVSAFLGSYLIRMFDLCGSLSEANKLFEDLQEQNCYTWTAIISAHVRHGEADKAIELYLQMQQSVVKGDAYTFVAVLKACACSTEVKQGKVIHAHVVEIGIRLDAHLGNSLIDMYAKCGTIEDAQYVFNTLPKYDVVTWNAIVSGYAQLGHGNKAFSFFQQMQQEGIIPDAYTYVSILKGCSTIQALERGKLIHTHLNENDLGMDAYLGTTLIDMYANCGSLDHAQIVFNMLPKKNLVTWNAMLEAYVHCARSYEALLLYEELQQQVEEPDAVTFISILKACSCLAALDEGKTIQTHIIIWGFECDNYIGNSLIDMYSKCGSLQDAQAVFDHLSFRDVVAWNAMITGYAQQGCTQTVLELFKQMWQEGTKQNIFTWNSIITGCAQHRFGEEALQFFQLMQEEGMEPDELTYAGTLKACSGLAALDQGKLLHAHAIESGGKLDTFVESALVDMYIKCGSADDAFRVFQKVSKEDVVTWNALITGYAVHSEYGLALQCFEEMQRQGLRPDATTLVTLLSVCSHLGLLDIACQCFQSITLRYGLLPTLEHYNCLVDLLGRSGQLAEAEDLLRTLPYEYNILHWTSLLANCRTYGNLLLGRQCFNHVVSINDRYASAYVLMFNLYADAVLLNTCMQTDRCEWKQQLANDFFEVTRLHV